MIFTPYWYGSTSWSSWGRWVLLGLVVAFVIALLLLWITSRRRVVRGERPIPFTGWAVGNPPAYSARPQTGEYIVNPAAYPNNNNNNMHNGGDILPQYSYSNNGANGNGYGLSDYKSNTAPPYMSSNDMSNTQTQAPSYTYPTSSNDNSNGNSYPPPPCPPPNAYTKV